MARRESYRAQRWGIINHVGTIWSPETFETREQAQAYLDAQKADLWFRFKMDLSKHHVAKLRLTLSIPKDTPQ